MIESKQSRGKQQKNKAVDEAIKQITTEVEKVISEKVESAEKRCKLKNNV